VNLNKRPSQLILLILLAVVLVSCGSSDDKKRGATTQPPQSLWFRMVESGLRVSWDQVPGAIQYSLFWGKEKGNYRMMFRTVQSTAVVTGLDPGELYTFAVTAWTYEGESDYSPGAVFVYDREPSRASKHLSKGHSLQRRGSLDEAHAYLSAAIRLDPHSAEAFRIRAQVNEKLNRKDLARKDYAMAETLFNEQPISLGPSDR
jgi:tetratricopeptide (TPR) repeat protein